jgi:adenylate kinase
VVQRLLKRAEIDGRADDTEDVIRHRLKVYDDETAPLAALYRERGLLHQVDGMGGMDTVAERLQAVLATLQS